MVRQTVISTLIGLAGVAVLARSSRAQESYGDPEEFVSAEVQVEPATFQPPAVPTVEAAPARPARRSARAEYVRIARAPNMFGDSLGTGGRVILIDSNVPGISDLPLGIGRSYRIAENNRPIPTDRIYFDYRSFQNALSTQVLVGPTFQPSDANIDRLTLGFEKTFFDETASIDVRVPFVTSVDVATAPGFGLSSGNFGDISIFYKDLLYADDMVAMAAGVGVGLPTSSDINGQIGGQPFRIETDSVHVMPYVGALIVPNDYWFFQMFAELDFAASGNDVVGASAQDVTSLTEQNLFHLNFSGGYWLYDNPDAYHLQGIAAILELHYTTTLNDADITPLPGRSLVLFGSEFNRFDVLNLTAGLHFQIGPLSNFRVACVTPLRSEIENRQFDAEIVASFNRFF